MRDEIGYGKPPKKSRFKPGTSGNPKGRPKRFSKSIVNVIDETLEARIEVRENGKLRAISARELTVKSFVDQAVSGDIEAASLILGILGNPDRFGERAVMQIVVHNGLPEAFQTSGSREAQDGTATSPYQGDESNPHDRRE